MAKPRHHHHHQVMRLLAVAPASDKARSVLATPSTPCCQCCQPYRALLDQLFKPGCQLWLMRVLRPQAPPVPAPPVSQAPSIESAGSAPARQQPQPKAQAHPLNAPPPAAAAGSPKPAAAIATPPRAAAAKAPPLPSRAAIREAREMGAKAFAAQKAASGKATKPEPVSGAPAAAPAPRAPAFGAPGPRTPSSTLAQPAQPAAAHGKEAGEPLPVRALFADAPAPGVDSAPRTLLGKYHCMLLEVGIACWHCLSLLCCGFKRLMS